MTTATTSGTAAVPAASRRSAFRHLERLRVRWAEVDAQKIVFNAHYLAWFDVAAAGWWRAAGLPYEPTLAHFGGDLYVKKATLEYHASARYDDVCEVGLRCAHIGRSSLRFDGGVFRGETLLVGGELLYVFADPATQTSRPVPDALRRLLLDFEAGEPVTTLRAGPWSALADAVMPLREAVFHREQGIGLEWMSDAADASALHAMVVNRLGRPLAAGRLLAPVDGVGKIGRMATDAACRGQGFAHQVLQALLAAARARGDREVRLHAQASAVGFYRRAGFVDSGPPFEEAGLPHQAMVRVP